jgi:hypothetical protein
MRRSAIGVVLGLAGVVFLLSPAASSGSVNCSYSGSDHVLTVATANSFGQVTRSGDAISVSDLFGRPTVCSGGSPTVTNTDRVLLRHIGDLSSTDIFMSGGPFAPGATLELDASSEIEFDFADDGIVYVDGTAGRDVLAWGPDNGLNLNFDLSGDRDVDVTPAPGKDGFIIAKGAGGADLIEPQADYSGDSVFSEGGPGNDVLIAPAIGGILDGGSGRDTILGGSVDLISGGRGKDLIRAGPGFDEIDAADRTKDRVLCGGGHDRVKADRVDKLKGCENVVRVPRRRAAVAVVAAATREEYIAQADPICQATIDAQKSAAGSGPTTVRLIKLGRLKRAGHRLERIFNAYAPGVEQLAVLQPAPGDTQLMGTWIEMLRAQVPLGHKAARVLIHERLPNKLLTRLGSLNTRTRTLVADYGFHSCQNF